MEKHFKGFTITLSPRAQNDEADRLTKAAARKQQLPPDVFFEEISTPSTRARKESRIIAIFSEDWRAPIMAYLWGHYELSDEAEEKRLSKSKRLCNLARRPIQIRGSNPLAQVHSSRSRHRTRQRDSLRHLRISHWNQTTCSKSF